MRVGTPRERTENEARVALVPDAVKRLAANGLDVVVESGAGLGAGHADAEYEAAGATVTTHAEEVWNAEVVAKVLAPLPDEIERLRDGQILVAMLQHLSRPDLVRALAGRGVSALAMDWMPRITRAQDMDARSSMSTVQGYKAVLLAADALPRVMPMMMTAAGTLAPAHVLVLGAGVAGLSAIATARRLGAVVEGFDVRPATREQVESLGARFVAMDTAEEGTQDAQGYAKAQSDEVLDLERQTIAKRLPSSDVVITTALIPGSEPPLLLTAAMLGAMRRGSVVVDLAAGSGGNCELTRPGESVVEGGVTVIGFTDLESRVAAHSSQMYARNVANFLLHLVHDGRVELDMDDEIVSFPLVAHAGRVVAESPQGGA